MCSIMRMQIKDKSKHYLQRYTWIWNLLTAFLCVFFLNSGHSESFNFDIHWQLTCKYILDCNWLSFTLTSHSVWFTFLVTSQVDLLLSELKFLWHKAGLLAGLLKMDMVSSSTQCVSRKYPHTITPAPPVWVIGIRQDASMLSCSLH